MELSLLQRKQLIGALCLSLTSTAQSSSMPELTTLYDYQLKSPVGENISLETLAKAMRNKDVILVGEWHTHPAIHLFEAQLLAKLNEKKSHQLALSMEQFARPAQIMIDHYLSEKIGEHYFIKASKAWPNYKSDYRPLIEFAKSHQLDVLATNTTEKIIKCLAREGIGYLDSLNAKERSYVASNLNIENSLYKEKFFAAMPHGEAKISENQYIAQTAWDDTMAETIVDFLKKSDKTQIMHIAGAFHVEEGLGIASRIKALNPKLDIGIISPMTGKETQNKDSDDFKLIVKPLPKMWLSYSEMRQSFSGYTHKKRQPPPNCALIKDT